MLHSLSMGELLIIFAIIIVLFGGSRLASVGKSLGEGIANFKKGLNNTQASEDNPEDKQFLHGGSSSPQDKPQQQHNVTAQTVQKQSIEHPQERKDSVDVLDVEAKDQKLHS
ncbi:MAG: twin-arginine translocase TatA/TatE family subunit [Silvanigrellaceae bacterium]|nr:twin-arginine translocase TatA/TatE family subunit [Silvanigrellaceae bacterium]